MKHTRKNICIALCILTVVTMFAACGKKDKLTDEEILTTEKTTKEQITIEEPGKETEKQTEKETTIKTEETTTKKAEVTTTKTVPSTTKPSTTKPVTPPSTTKVPERKPASTTHKQESTTKKPESTTKPTTTKPKPYSCGKSKHHCASKEEHTFIVSLEDKGCTICGSHSCKSFYVLDEWGNPCYDITRCPKYSEKKDPSNYCEHCGKKIGLGDNGTCVRFTVETKCPICKKTVAAKTCHTH